MSIGNKRFRSWHNQKFLIFLVLNVSGTEETRPIHRVVLLKYTETGAQASAEVNSEILQFITFCMNGKIGRHL